MSTEKLTESILRAEPTDRIMAALNDDPISAGIIDDLKPNAVIGSRIFNVASAAMIDLKEKPMTKLLGKEITTVSPEDWLGRFTLRILNDSLKRPGSKKLSYVSKLADTEVPQSEAESSIGSAFTDIKSQSSEPLTVMIDSSGAPIFAQTNNENIYAINFKAVYINNIRYAGGTLLDLKINSDCRSVNQNNIIFRLASKTNLESITPQRFSAYTFKPEDRTKVFTPIPGFSSSELAAHDNDELPTISYFLSCLPEVKELRKVNQILSKNLKN
ncbi:MAG: hypothetical protein NVS1B10_07730 [Candidatus Saccharimonadales bacterium]